MMPGNANLGVSVFVRDRAEPMLGNDPTHINQNGNGIGVEITQTINIEVLGKGRGKNLNGETLLRIKTVLALQKAARQFLINLSNSGRDRAAKLSFLLSIKPQLHYAGL